MVMIRNHWTCFRQQMFLQTLFNMRPNGPMSFHSLLSRGKCSSLLYFVDIARCTGHLDCQRALDFTSLGYLVDSYNIISASKNQRVTRGLPNVFFFFEAGKKSDGTTYGSVYSIFIARWNYFDI